MTIIEHSMLGDDDLLLRYSKQTRPTEHGDMPLSLDDLCADLIHLGRKGGWESTKNAVSQ